MVHGVNKPDAIVFIHNVNDICFHIKRHFLSENIFNLAFIILKNNFGRLIHYLHASPERSQGHVLCTAVKENHICSSYHFYKQRLHVIHVNLEGTGIYSNDLLYKAPVLWKLHLFKLAYLPHTVVFNDDPFWPIEGVISHQTLWRQVFKFIDDFYAGPAFLQFFRVKFHLSLFAEDKKRGTIYLKIILINRKIQEGTLAAFQESCHKIYGNSDFFFHIFVQSLL